MILKKPVFVILFIMMQIVLFAFRADVFTYCIPIGICLSLDGGYFIYRGIQSIVLLILRKVGVW